MKDYIKEYLGKTPLSEKFYNRAKEVMPGGVSHNIHYFPPRPFYLKNAKGSRIWDVDGNEYIDLWMGHFTHILGHKPEVIVEAVEKQLIDGIHWGIVFENQIIWAELICKIVPSAEMVRFCCSGTEATMYAIRVARAFTGKKTILKIAGGWHGANPDLSVGIKMPYEREESMGLLEEAQNFTKIIFFNDISKTLDIINQNQKDLAAIILEPVIGEGGFVSASLDYLKTLRLETERLGALLIFDEIISGFRVELGGAQERYGIIPDLTTLGKIMGGGFPVGAICGRKDILEKTSPERTEKKWERILIGGGTFSSHPFTASAGIAMLNYLKDNREKVYPILEERGKKIREGMQMAFASEGIEAIVTGTGSLFQTNFPKEKGKSFNSPHSIHQWADIDKREVEFRLRMLTKGIHLMHGGGALSIAHSEEDIEKIIIATKEVAKEMKNEMALG